MKILTRCLIPWIFYAVSLLAFFSIALKDLDVQEPSWQQVIEVVSQPVIEGARLLADENTDQAVAISEEEKMQLISERL
jgi:hypothetical protein